MRRDGRAPGSNMEIIITNCHELIEHSTACGYSTPFNASLQASSLVCTSLYYHTTFPSEFSFRVLQVSNFHDIELLMRIVALDNANATDALQHP